MWLVEFSLAYRIPVAYLAYHEMKEISISCINYSRKREVSFKNLSLFQQNLKHDGIYGPKMNLKIHFRIGKKTSWKD